MEVIFESKSRSKGIERSRGKGEITMLRQEHSDILFRGGIFKTSIRDEIQYLLHSRYYKEGMIKLVTDIDKVDEYLLGDLPEKLTEDLLNNIDHEGLVKIASVNGIPRDRHQNKESLIKTIVKGKPVNNILQRIIDQHTIDDNISEKDERDLFTKLKDDGVVYKKGAWYKFRKKDEQNPDQDYTLGRSETEAAEWVLDNQDKAEEKIDADNS